ncbi:uncharacterized protein LY79DRAFT_413490 [Colletotrichum navitas]|uniref:Uncharacterized protein n=1 Tax=Colletotrichum navitas TaxID=681940 RepID=A0AAD8UY60_9PEZI|nr:uncharacterized protein LY79DRAFT_413490 [Colletotrichum navitas]KAK1573386.1 hypothetical protein LY79DRAFT_413490 [Colletotrichum navitas]
MSAGRVQHTPRSVHEAETKRARRQPGQTYKHTDWQVYGPAILQALGNMSGGGWGFPFRLHRQTKPHFSPSKGGALAQSQLGADLLLSTTLYPYYPVCTDICYGATGRKVSTRHAYMTRRHPGVEKPAARKCKGRRKQRRGGNPSVIRKRLPNPRRPTIP